MRPWGASAVKHGGLTSARSLSICQMWSPGAMPSMCHRATISLFAEVLVAQPRRLRQRLARPAGEAARSPAPVGDRISPKLRFARVPTNGLLQTVSWSVAWAWEGSRSSPAILRKPSGPKKLGKRQT